MKSHLRIVLLYFLCVAAFASPLHAGAKYTRTGFAFAGEDTPTVVVVRPNIFVGALDSKKQQVADPEWLQRTHTNLQQALQQHPIANIVELRFADWNNPETPALSERVWEPFRYVSSDIIMKVPQGTSPVDTSDGWQKRMKAIPKGTYNYVMPAEAVEEIKQKEGAADYALLVVMHDAYTTSGARLARLLAGMVDVAKDGYNFTPLPPHHGSSMLVDLSDGSVVWFYGDGAFGGDLRQPDYAGKRVAQMLTRFPNLK